MIVCFGDSNTYGYDPRSFFGEQYEPQDRWVDRLAMKSGEKVVNAGMNGRTVPNCSYLFPDDITLLIVMLGTNDLLQGSSVAETASAMERFLLSLSVPCERILLIAPPPMVRGAWVADASLIETSRELSCAYRKLAQCRSFLFADAGKWEIPMCFDGVHFTEEGHRRFLDGLYEFLVKENLLCLKSE